MVIGPTEYPSGERLSTGAPVASWYDGWESLPPFSSVYLRLPSDTSALLTRVSAGASCVVGSSLSSRDRKGRRQLKDIVFCPTMRCYSCLLATSTQICSVNNKKSRSGESRRDDVPWKHDFIYPSARETIHVVLQFI